MKIHIPKPIVPDAEYVSKRENEDLNILQKALEIEGYIVFKDRDEYLTSVQTLNRTFNEEQLG